MLSSKRKILDFIAKYMAENGWSPSIREIAEAVGLASSSTVQKHLMDLKDQGKIIYNGIRQIKVIRR